MNIFGFTITRTSKKKEEEKELEIFEKCVNAIDFVTREAIRVIQEEPEIHVVQRIAEAQEHLESLIEIYLKCKFSRPASAFNLIELIHEMRTVYSKYATHASNRAMTIAEFTNIKSAMGSDDDSYDSIVKEHFLKAIEQKYKNAHLNTQLAAKEYFVSLNAIRFTITYDITRIAIGTDIIKQYRETKGYKIPQKGIEFTVKFKKLSRDELIQQKLSKEDKEDERSTNGV